MTIHRIAPLLLLAFVAQSFTSSAHQAAPVVTPAELKSRLDAFIPSAMAELGVVPGLSIAVVRNDKTIYAAGFGVADTSARTPVTADTVFYTASLAKTVTGLTAASLISQGRFTRDTPLTTLLPGLVLPTGTDVKKATLGGLLGHDPGFGSPTVNYVTTFVRPYTMAELVTTLNNYSQTLPQFVYANSNYAIAGMLIEQASQHPWKDVIASTVFAPLGMRKSSFSMAAGATAARPYRADADGFTRLHLVKTDRTTTGAGGFFSTATDLAQLVKAFLNDGKVDGRQAIPAATMRLTQVPNTSTSSTFAYFKRTGYGIGLYLGSYDDEAMPHHFGGIDGYRAHMSFMPQRGYGVAVLQNEGGNGSQFADLVAAYAYDVLLGKPADERARVRIQEYRAALDKSRAEPPAWIAELKRFAATPAALALPVDRYVGTYRSERLGDLSLIVDNGRLRVAFGELRGLVVPTSGERVLVDYGGGGSPDAWKFVIDAGVVTGIDWGGRAFSKLK